MIKDVLLYASHIDPQLKGAATLICGNLIKSSLSQGRGDFTKWVEEFAPGKYILFLKLIMLKDRRKKVSAKLKEK